MSHKPTYRNWIYLAIIFSAFILIALLNSCKSRKVEKDYSKTIDKTEQTTVKKENVVTNDLDFTSTKIDVKEATETNNTFDTETATVLTFDSVGRIKQATINKKSKGQNLSKSDKSDNTKIDFIAEHSELKEIDSTGIKKTNTKQIVKQKKVDAKMNWIQIGVGAGVFVCILLIALFAFRKYK